MAPLEIERKFLIRQTEEMISACCEEISIVQTYLERSDSDLQRRVRSWTKDGSTRYFYTEKRFISPSVREENEREISLEEYISLLSEADRELRPIIKTRRLLSYKNQDFEIDSYPFSSELATMELELSHESQEIIFPPFVEIIKEVTGNSAYSNANLALSGKFPDEDKP